MARKKSREEISDMVQDMGESLHALRMECLESGMPYIAGKISAAEDTLLVAKKDYLDDVTVLTKEL